MENMILGRRRWCVEVAVTTAAALAAAAGVAAVAAWVTTQCGK